MKTTEAIVLLNGTDNTYALDTGHCAGGLAVTPVRLLGKLPKDPWTITHILSGKKVVHHTFNTTTAKKLMSLLLSLPIDWTEEEKTVYKQAKADPVTLKKINLIYGYNPNISNMKWLLEDLNACNPS